MSARVAEVQVFLDRTILVENVSSYLAFADATIPEWEFVAALTRRTAASSCDVNNIHVNAVNHGFDADAYLAALPSKRSQRFTPRRLRVDARMPRRHARRARRAAGLRTLYRRAIARFGPVPTLIEWDTDIPPLRSFLPKRRPRGRFWRPPLPSLRELQRDFAATASRGRRRPRRRSPRFRTRRAVERMCVYRRALFANYRNALAATYPVVKRLVGAPFFDAAVDAFVDAHPATSGDLNLYGDTFGAFLSVYPPAASLPYLGDVAALEWAQDEANRAADYASSPQEVLADLTLMAPADCRRRDCARAVVPSPGVAPSDPAHLAGQPGRLPGR
jgi:hypothetical protein